MIYIRYRDALCHLHVGELESPANRKPSRLPGDGCRESNRGHEGSGVIEEIGSAVTEFKRGDKGLIACISFCGKCLHCCKDMYSHGEQDGWILGHLIDGTQAEYVRIPFADTRLYHIPETVDENVMVMLSDILPTGFECGVLNGQVLLMCGCYCTGRPHCQCWRTRQTG